MAPKKRNGQTFNCLVCGKEFYRAPAQIARGSTKTCSKACLAEHFAGKGNPFFGKSHSPKTKSAISNSRKGKAVGNKNAKGYQHTEEAKKRIAIASRKMWSEQRDKILSSKPKGWAHANFKPPELRRYRKNFTPRQRREWKDSACCYCGSTNDLVLDHIIPIFDGGTNARANCQTLCRGCNLWKVQKVDLPRYFASQAAKGAEINPE